MQIVTFCTLNKKFFRKKISKDTTIEEAKRILCEETSEFNLQSIKMIYNKQVLHNSTVISSLELKEKDYILVIIKSEITISQSEQKTPEIKPLPFIPEKSEKKHHKKGFKTFYIINKKTNIMKIVTCCISDINKKKYRVLTKNKKETKKESKPTSEKRTRKQVIQARSTHRRVSRIIFSPHLSSTSNRLYFLPINFRNKQLHLANTQSLRRISNILHFNIILKILRYMQFLCFALLKLILMVIYLVYLIFSL